MKIKKVLIVGSLVLATALIFFIGVPTDRELFAQFDFDSNPRSQVECVNLSSRIADLTLVSDNNRTVTRKLPGEFLVAAMSGAVYAA